MGRHSGPPSAEEDEPVPFWPAKPVGMKPLEIKRYPGEPTVPCVLCEDPINPRREVHYSDGERRWCDRHGVVYRPGSP